MQKATRQSLEKLWRKEDGYVSWSPKETFERAYRKMTLKEAEMVAGGQFVISDASGSTVRVA